MDNRQVGDFPTKDIYLAAAIKVKGAKLLRVDPVGKRAIFVFSNTPELKSSVTSYMNRELTHECQELFETWKQLKSLVFSVLEDVK
jgi:hypothetical protein